MIARGWKRLVQHLREAFFPARLQRGLKRWAIPILLVALFAFYAVLVSHNAVSYPRMPHEWASHRGSFPDKTQLWGWVASIVNSYNYESNGMLVFYIYDKLDSAGWFDVYSMRFISALSGLFCLGGVAAFYLSRRGENRAPYYSAAGLYAAVFLVANVLFLGYTSFARFYAFNSACGVLAMLFLVAACERNRPALWVGYTLALCLSIASMMMSAVAVAIHAVVVWGTVAERSARRRFVTCAALGLALFALLWAIDSDAHTRMYRGRNDVEDVVLALQLNGSCSDSFPSWLSHLDFCSNQFSDEHAIHTWLLGDNFVFLRAVCILGWICVVWCALRQVYMLLQRKRGGVTVCSATNARVDSTEPDCAADGDACGSVRGADGVACATDGVACATDGVACATDGVACATDGVACATDGVACATDGVACATSGADCAIGGADRGVSRGSARASYPPDLGGLMCLGLAVVSGILALGYYCFDFCFKPLDAAWLCPFIALAWGGLLARCTPLRYIFLIALLLVPGYYWMGTYAQSAPITRTLEQFSSRRHEARVISAVHWYIPVYAGVGLRDVEQALPRGAIRPQSLYLTRMLMRHNILILGGDAREMAHLVADIHSLPYLYKPQRLPGLWVLLGGRNREFRNENEYFDLVLAFLQREHLAEVRCDARQQFYWIRPLPSALAAPVEVEEGTRVPVEERTRVLAEERPRVPAEERTRVPAEERPRVPAEDRPRVPAEERTHVPAEVLRVPDTLRAPRWK